MPRPSLRALLVASVAGVICLAEASPALALEYTVTDSSNPAPGLRIDALSIDAPKTKAWVAYVDLCAAEIRVDATASPSSLRTAGSWGSDVGATLAINGDFYKTGPVRVYGAAVGDGSAWPASKTGTDPGYADEWYYQRYGWLAFGDGWVELDHTEWVKNNASVFGGLREGWRPTDVTHALPHGTRALVSGFPELVVEGTRVTCSSPTASDCFVDRSDMRDRHPRTAMGITEDRRQLILAVVDGRTSISIGMYGTELAELMEDVGAWNAFNLDGGGSTQMWLDGSGYLNNTSGNNSGGGTRSVANHWGIFTGTGSGAPDHCVDYLVEGVLNVAKYAGRSSDLNGDGRADACLRASDGLRCSLALEGAQEGGFSPEELLVALDDDSGWDDLRNAATLRMGDVDGDGRVDACLRANAGIRCWLSDEGPLATQIQGPGHSDEGGWNALPYHSTFRLADVDGDGRDDVVARASIGLVYYPSTGDGFGETVETGIFSDEDGFADPDNYMTLRMGDIDGDGKADACARTNTSMECHLAPDFAEMVVGPAWSDEQGWATPMRWASIRLRDIDGDGRADLCGRASEGIVCHRSEGTSFGVAIETGLLSDAEGFDLPSRYGTIRLADIDGDRDLDLCARPDDWACWPWTGEGFGAALAGPGETTAAELLPRLYAGARLADVDGDGRADLCGRDEAGLWCARSEGDGFGPKIAGPAWAGQGFESAAVFGTLSLGQPACTAGIEWCNGFDDDCDGEIDEDCDDPPATGGAGGATGSGGGPQIAPSDAEPSGGCACRAAGGPSPRSGWGLLALMGLALLRRRR